MKLIALAVAVAGAVITLAACGGGSGGGSSGVTGNAAVCAVANQLATPNTQSEANTQLTNAQLSNLDQQLANAGSVSDAQLSSDLGSLSSDWSASDQNPEANAIVVDGTNVIGDCRNLGYN
jgi:hypothetical protein